MTDAITIRSFRASDHHAVLRLYTRGLVIGDLDPNDTAADLDCLESAYLTRPQDHMWVAACSAGVVGMIAVYCEDDGVALVRRLRVDPAWHHTPLMRILLTHALNHCFHHACIKVIIDTHVPDAVVEDALDGTGYQFSRRRKVWGRHVYEVYIDLYRERDHAKQCSRSSRPQPPTKRPAAPHGASRHPFAWSVWPSA